MNTVKIDVTVDGLRGMASMALSNGTEAEFIRVALQWAEQANAEIVLLRRKNGKLGVALTMIREGCDEPRRVASEIIERIQE